MWITSRILVLFELLLSPDTLQAWRFVLMLLVFCTLSDQLLNAPFPTVPSVAPANVSGGNGRRHELVILWEVSPQTHHFSRSCVTTQVQAHKYNIESGDWVKLLFLHITNNNFYLLYCSYLINKDSTSISGFVHWNLIAQTVMAPQLMVK